MHVYIIFNVITVVKYSFSICQTLIEAGRLRNKKMLVKDHNLFEQQFFTLCLTSLNYFSTVSGRFECARTRCKGINNF